MDSRPSSLFNSLALLSLGFVAGRLFSKISECSSSKSSAAGRIAAPELALLEMDVGLRAREANERKRRRKVRFIIIRHGESEMNLQPGVVGGRSNDTPLSAEGRKQAEALGTRIKREKLHFDEVYSSTAVRAIDTALLSGVDPKYLVKSPAILEISMGGYVGKPREDVYTSEVMTQINANCIGFRPPGNEPDGDHTPGESQLDVEERVGAFIDSLLKPQIEQQSQSSSGDRTIALYMQGMAIRCFLRRVLGASSTAAVHMTINNTSITELVYETNRKGNLSGWWVVRVNDHSHLSSL